MHTEFIDCDDPRWKECLSKSDNEFYQHHDFVRLDSELLDGIPMAWYGEYKDGWMLIPLIKRKIPDEITNGKEYYDLSSPYGYPGVLSSSYKSIHFFLKLFNDDAGEIQSISTFIRLNPFLNPYLLHETSDVTQVVHGQIVMLDMTDPFKKQRRKYSSNHRRNIKKLAKAGYTLRWNEWDKIDVFLDIYNETMRREDASEYYFFPSDYYLELKEILGESNIDLVFAQNNEEVIVAGGIFCKNDQLVQYHLGGTRSEYLSKAPSKLLFDGIIKKYSEQVDYFNLGGGVGSNDDSLFRFKEGFGKEYTKFSTLRMVNDRQRYNNLCRHYAKEELYDLAGYFPLYRKEQ